MKTMNGELFPEPRPLKKWVVTVVLYSERNCFTDCQKVSVHTEFTVQDV